MIILFIISDALGKSFRFSTTCGPSTTGLGAVNILQTRLSIPPEVSIELRLENDVAVKHLTAPLTSLRKQRGGVVKVLCLNLFAHFTGPAEALGAINYGSVEEYTTTADDNSDDEEAVVAVPETEPHSEEVDDGDREGSANSKDVGVSSHQNGETEEGSVGGVAPPRVVKVAPVNVRKGSVGRPSDSAVPTHQHEQQHERGRSPEATSAASAAAPVRIRRPSVLSPPGTSTSASPERVQIRKPVEDAPVSARGRGRVVESARAAASAGATTEAAAAGGAEQEVAEADDEDEDLTAEEAVKPALVSGVPRQGDARRAIGLAGIIRREYPKICEDESQMLAFIKDEQRMLHHAYNTEFKETSTMEGLSDAEYAKCVSLGHIFGIEMRAGTGVGRKIAFYPEMMSLRHSCRPNAAVHYETYIAPYAGSCRCAALDGIAQGEEITFLYPYADSQAFLLLSCDRRRNILRKRYFFECNCPRCAATTNLVSDPEAALTGCQFADSSVDADPAQQAKLSEEMRADFDALQIMDDEGLEINLCPPGNIPPAMRAKRLSRLLGFIRKYGGGGSPLRLHDHHWRMNLARAAYIFETVKHCAVQGTTPAARARAPRSMTLFTPSKTVFDLCLKQLVAESVFIPRGHPHMLSTYDAFMFLVAVLPPNVRRSVEATARSTSRINWADLERVREAWDLRKRTSLPPQMRKQAQPNTSIAATRSPSRK